MPCAQNWDVKLCYYGRHRKSSCDELGAKFYDDLDTFLGACSIVTVNVPLTDKTRCKPFPSWFAAHAACLRWGKV